MGIIETVGEITLFLGGVTFFIIIIFLARHSEKKKWNNGVCPNCETDLVLNAWMLDSQGGRGWTCPKIDCNYTAWVSYNVDKKARA